MPGGDSGELVQLAVELGVAHPPGYPTWTLIAHLFSWIPFGEVGWRVNLSSAVLNALAVSTTTAAVAQWCGCIWTGVVAGGAFAFAPQVHSFIKKAATAMPPPPTTTVWGNWAGCGGYKERILPCLENT